MSWFPDAGSDQELVNGLAMYGQVLAVAREKIRGAFGHYFSGNRIVTIVPKYTIEDVPDFKDIRVHGNLYTCRFTVMGLKPRCHNCSQRGHVARDCNACTRCGSAGHGTSDHPRHIPVTSFADRVRHARRPAPEYVPGDIDEMEAQSSEGATGPPPPPPHVPSSQQQPQPNNVSAQATKVDGDGFRTPKSKRTKRRRNRHRQTPPSEAVFTGDEEESDFSEDPEDKSDKVPRTDNVVHDVSSNTIATTPLGETWPPLGAPPTGDVATKPLGDPPTVRPTNTVHSDAHRPDQEGEGGGTIS